MSRKKIGLIIIGLILIVGAILIKTKFLANPGLGALSISTSPKATIWLDNQSVGNTPFLDDKIKPGEHLVKIVPENNQTAWEGKVNLTANLLTVINRSWEATDSQSAGEIIWLEKIANRNKVDLTVITQPNEAMIKVDSQPKGFSPLNLNDLEPANFQIIISSPGYEEKLVTAKAVAGYKLIINAQLVKTIANLAETTSESAVITSGTPTPSPKITPKEVKATTTPPPKPYVIIKETPTGWLRVRDKPNGSAEELAKVNPGEKYSYLEEKENGWYKIEYEADKEGWVSGIYVELVE